MKSLISIRLLNVCGGALFAYGSLGLIQGIVVAVGYEIQCSVQFASFQIIDSTKPGGRSKAEKALDSSLTSYYTDQIRDFTSRQGSFLIVATVGAGLACLREKSRE